VPSLKQLVDRSLKKKTGFNLKRRLGLLTHTTWMILSRMPLMTFQRRSLLLLLTRRSKMLQMQLLNDVLMIKQGRDICGEFEQAPLYGTLSNIPISIVQAFVTFMLQRDPDWQPDVTAQSPWHVCLFITKKCGPVADGCEGKKVYISHLSRLLPCIEYYLQFSTAISTRAALTYFYKSLRPDESVTEWRVDKDTNQWYVLLTTQYPANNSLLYAAMVSPLIHPWFHSS